MPRQQTPTPSLLELQPAARPTDQFAAPEVRAPQTSASQLTQLAGALAHTSSDMQEVFNQRAQAEDQQAQRTAIEDVAAAKAKNVLGFQDAVAKGLIKETDNPWYTTTAQSLFAQSEAEQHAVSAWNEYAQSPLRNDPQTTPQTVSGFFQERFQKAMQGKTPAEMAAMSHVFEQHLAGYLSDDVTHRAAVREEALQTGLQDRGAAVLQANPSDHQVSIYGDVNPTTQETGQEEGRVTGEGVADPTQPNPSLSPYGNTESEAAVSGVVASLQQQLSEAEAVTEPGKAAAWVRNVVYAEAFRRKDRDLAPVILSRLKNKDGTSLLDTGGAQAQVEELRGKIVHRIFEDDKLENEREHTRAERETRPIIGWVQQEHLKLKEKDPNAKLSDVKIPLEQLKNLAPDSYELLQSRYHTLIAQDDSLTKVEEQSAKDKLVMRLFGDGLRGRLTPDQELDIFDALMAVHGGDMVFTYQNLKDRRRDEQWGATSPDTLNDLWDYYRAGKLTPDLLGAWANNGYVSRSDFDYFMPKLAASGNGQADTVSDLDANLQELITAKTMDTEGVTSRSELRNNDGFLQRLSAARMTFEDEAQKMQRSPEFQKLDYDQKRQKMLTLLDTVSETYGGLKRTELLERTKKQQETPKTVVSPFISPESSPNPLITRIAQVDPTIGKVGTDQLRILSWAANAKPRLINGQTPADMPTPFEDPGQQLGIGLFESPKEDVVKQWLRYRATEKPDQQPDAPGNVLINGQPTSVMSVRKAIQAGEIRVHERAMAQTRALAHVIEDNNVVGHLDDLAAVLKQRQEAGDLYISPDEKRRMLIYQNLLERYATYRKYVGADVQDVKKMGEGAWRAVPLFVNELDLEQRGKDMMQALGLGKDNIKDFIESQRRLMSGRPSYK